EDAAVMQALGVLRLGELVVRAAHDRATGQAWDRFGVERAADGAGGVDVRLRLEDALGWNRLAARRGRPLLLDVTDENPCAGLGQLPRKDSGHRARTLHQN